MGEAVRTTLEQWDTASTVISVLVTCLIGLIGGFILWFKTGPVTRKAARAAARQSDATAGKMTLDGAFGLIDRLETRLQATEKESAEAKEEAQQAAQQIGVLRQEHSSLEDEIEEIRDRYDSLRAWVSRIVSNWSVIRQNEDPPDLPPNHQ